LYLSTSMVKWIPFLSSSRRYRITVKGTFIRRVPY
jgi:hypothetical protein